MLEARTQQQCNVGCSKTNQLIRDSSYMLSTEWGWNKWGWMFLVLDKKISNDGICEGPLWKEDVMALNSYNTTITTRD